MRGMIVSALTGLAVLIMGLIMIYLTPAARREASRPSEMDEIRARNADLERRIAALEARLAGVAGGSRNTAV